VKKGFSLIELLVAIAISALLSAIAIVYSNQGQSQIALSVEATKVAQLTLQARQLAIATYSVGALACGYGMYFNVPSSTYSLFVYTPPIAQSTGYCPSIASTTAAGFHPATDMVQYSNETWNVHTSQGVSMYSNTTSTPSLVAVIFIPPNPTTLIANVNNATSGGYLFGATTSYVNLITTIGGATKNVGVNQIGQATF